MDIISEIENIIYTIRNDSTFYLGDDFDANFQASRINNYPFVVLNDLIDASHSHSKSYETFDRWEINMWFLDKSINLDDTGNNVKDIIKDMRDFAKKFAIALDKSTITNPMFSINNYKTRTLKRLLDANLYGVELRLEAVFISDIDVCIP